MAMAQERTGSKTMTARATNGHCDMRIKIARKLRLSFQDSAPQYWTPSMVWSVWSQYVPVTCFNMFHPLHPTWCRWFEQTLWRDSVQNHLSHLPRETHHSSPCSGVIAREAAEVASRHAGHPPPVHYMQKWPPMWPVGLLSASHAVTSVVDRWFEDWMGNNGVYMAYIWLIYG